ncbi:MAG: 2-oxoacid:acceptor oxidoreductase subunit alpha [Deltaproteobacteria bacterium]|nr:2-oxoacid:acceptor oxidoreductase subunit alpha [Deltaproteobacteria bacterium]
MENTQTERKELVSAAIRFAGDSGDGMQVTGARFTHESARLGNDLATRPDFPAEIRAPAGTIGGVSAFQIHFGSTEVFTAGDDLDALIAMNPAALKANVKDLKQNGILICNTDSFTEKNLIKAHLEENPLDQDAISTKYNLISVPITTLTHEALSELELPKSAIERCKNFFALGIICWMYGRGVKETSEWVERKFKSKPEIAKANKLALEGGMAFAEASEAFSTVFEVPKAKLAQGTYKNITGNQGLAHGLIAASVKAGVPLVYAGYPITPASDILHEISRYKNFGVTTFQAEDEIAACCAAIGASYAGGLGVTGSSGPGILLKQEALALAAVVELPLVVVNVQRAGPSTGMPTKTEQADLLQSLYGRNSDCPVVVLAIASPDDSFDTSYLAAKIALEHMVPVILLSDGYVGNGSQPWLIPDESSLSEISPKFAQTDSAEAFQPYQRDEETLARAWSIPGMKGLEHRVGGLEKQDITGNISYDPDNHQRMTYLRAEKVKRVANTYPKTEVSGADSGELLVVSWGGTHGAVAGAVAEEQKAGRSVSHLHLRYINPLPNDLEQVLSRFKKILVPELNSGQLSLILNAHFDLNLTAYNKVQGQPFKISEIQQQIQNLIR